ncbi:hypothetical protein MU0083_001588 [[Mycobacterium] kokjensenii]|uniref:Transmembrane protein n=1 Tax=[Mycobacterium] kokjensenii TaxID=3064287 RepID=A0ABM9LDC6_9MYCO|nr:hypothetical protein [Mycolicibacter sp. MU0083]CAJ1497107.1 hypothetical protein MU0083_001588 [Mycolicibacter sp. MU0083]
MLIIAMVLAAIGLAALVFAVVTSNALVAWVCVGASLLGVLLLIVDALRERRANLPASAAEDAEDSDADEGAESTEAGDDLDIAAESETTEATEAADSPADAAEADSAAVTDTVADAGADTATTEETAAQPTE